MTNFYLILADAILLVHGAIVLFIVLGLVLIWIGYFRRWKFVRNVPFRLGHLIAIGYVAVQTIVGADCPLTNWENEFRVRGGAGKEYEETFVGHWLGKVLFYEIGLGTFAIIYTVFFLSVAFSWYWVRPRRNADQVQ